MLINNPVITGSFIVNGVSVAGITGSSELSSSYLALSASYLITSASYAQSSASLSIRTGNLEVTSSTLVSASSSFAAQSASLSSRVSIVEGQDATTGSNVFTGTQYISEASNAISFTSTASLYTDGGLRVSKDSFVSGTAYFNNIVVYGTSSIEYITSSQVDIGANIITVNTDTPAVRFGGLSVFDSGSTQLTGSLFWDSETNHWVYSNPSGSSYSGGMIMSGPRASSLGTEQGTTNNALMKGQGGDHITSSQVIDDGTTVRIPGNFQVTGSTILANTSFTGSVNVSGSFIVTTTAPELTVGATGVTLGNVLTDVHQITGSLRVTGSGVSYLLGGNVLIGTSVDNGSKLQVLGGINVKGNDGYNGWIISQTGGSASAAFNLSYGAGGAQNVITAQYDTGNVGIGTSSPGQKLEVIGNVLVRNTLSNASFYLAQEGDNSSTFYQYNNGTLRNVIASNGNSYFTGGNVGIGASTNPQNLLEVSTAGGSPRIRVGTLQNNNNTARFEAITSNSISTANSAWLRVTPGGGFVLGQSNYTKTGGDSGNFANLSSEVESPFITVSGGGNVLIGNTTDNGAKLQVGQYSALSQVTTPTFVTLDNSYAASATQAGNKLKLYLLRGDVNMGFGCGNIGDLNAWSDGLFRIYTGGNESMRITSGGDIGMGAASITNIRLYVQGATNNSSTQAINVSNSAGTNLFYARNDGYLYSVGAWSGSDIRLKENITDLDNGLQKILGLKAKKFDLKDGLKNNFGFIAQEMQEVIPDAVSVFEEKEQLLAVRMDFIIPHLVKAIQELSAKVDAQAAEINELKNR